MVGNLKLSNSTQCIKYLMFIFNLLFVISGIVLISIGSVIYGVYHEYEHFLDSRYFSVPNLLIAIGSIIFIIAFFGCCGAVKENYCMIVTFTALVVLVFILELSAGISGYVLRNVAQKVLQEKMEDTMSKFMANDEYNTIWYKMQQKFSCCGTTKPEQWVEILYEQSKNDTIKVDRLLPQSCCEIRTSTVGRDECSMNTDHFPDGCLPKISEFVMDHAVQLGAAGLAIAFMQGLGIWFSVYLAKAIKKSYNNM